MLYVICRGSNENLVIQFIHREIERIIISQDVEKEITSFNDFIREDLWLLPQNCGLTLASDGLYLSYDGMNRILMDHIHRVICYVIEKTLKAQTFNDNLVDSALRKQLTFILDCLYKINKLPTISKFERNITLDHQSALVKKNSYKLKSAAEKRDVVNLIELEFYQILLRFKSKNRHGDFVLNKNMLKSLNVFMHKITDGSTRLTDIFNVKFRSKSKHIHIQFGFPSGMSRLIGGLSFDALSGWTVVDNYTTTAKRLYTKTGFSDFEIVGATVRDIVRFECAILIAQIVVWGLRHTKHHYVRFGLAHAKYAKTIRELEDSPSSVFDRVLEQSGFKKTKGVYITC